MDSRELGLVLTQQLLDVEDLHYGWWEEGETPSLAKLAQAQQRYSARLIEAVAQYCPAGGRILDVGCGTGRVMELLLAEGYEVDGVIPAPWLEREVRRRIARCAPACQPTVFPCRFEDMPDSAANSPYDLLLFSESFQYIPLESSLTKGQTLLRPGGAYLVCDFFQTIHHGDGQPGDKSFGGGHKLTRFHALLDAHAMEILRDDDITRFISPSVALVDEVLRERVAPACGSLDEFLRTQYPRLRWLIRRFFRNKLEKLQYKYLQNHRTQATFERYKSYRLVAFRPQATAA